MSQRFEITKDLVGDYHVHPDIEQFVEVGAPVEIEVVLASEVERLRGAITAVVQQMKEDGDDYVLDYAKRLEDALNASDGGATLPVT